MIGFFRRIRKKLADDNQFFKYSRYAIGEIVLVVIGILIALQINNNNILNQERAVEKTYLISLKQEFKANKILLEETIELNNYLIDQAQNLIGLFEKGVLDTISEGAVVNYFFETFSNEINYTPRLGVLTEIISSGNLKLIQNQELKHRLASFESELEKIKHQENEVNIPRLEIMDIFRNQANFKRYLEELGNEYDWMSIFEDRSNKELFTTLKMFNSLYFFQITSSAANQLCYIPVRDDIEITISLIDSELNR